MRVGYYLGIDANGLVGLKLFYVQPLFVNDVVSDTSDPKCQNRSWYKL